MSCIENMKHSNQESKAKEILDRCLALASKDDCDDEVNYDYPLKSDEIEEIILDIYDISDECPHCGHGETNLLLLKLVDDKGYATINNWCGCLTYEPSYTIKHHITLEKAKNHISKIRTEISDRSQY
jgi:uncharacterized protein (UPF0297 family)